MEQLWDAIQNTDYSQIPLAKISLVVLLLICTLVVRQIVFALVIKRIERWAGQTETDIDDELLKILRPSVTLLIFIAALWIIPLIFVGDLNPELSDVITGALKVVTLIGIVFIAYRTSSVLGLFASTLLIRALARVTGKTEETMDSNLVAVLRPSLRLLIFLLALWVVQLFLAGDLNADLNQTVSSGLNLLTILVIATVVYRSASILGQLTANLLLATTEEAGLSEMLRPFLPKLFQAIAIIVIVIKGAEVFFGGSTGPLVGLLGGAGITLGLLFKDMIYDWFCTVIIYTDKLYKEGDWLVVSDLDGFVQVVEVGFRTTTLLLSKWGSIQKIPNSKMITGIVQNWSQDADKEEVWGIPLKLKIDGISSQQASRILEGLKEIHQALEGVSNKALIRFSGLEQNARIFDLWLYVNDTSLYYDVEEKANLSILELLEKEGIDALYVELETDPERYRQHLKALKN